MDVPSATSHVLLEVGLNLRLRCGRSSNVEWRKNGDVITRNGYVTSGDGKYKFEEDGMTLVVSLKAGVTSAL